MERFSDDSFRKTVFIPSELVQRVRDEVSSHITDMKLGVTRKKFNLDPEYRERTAEELQAAEDDIIAFKKQADFRRKISFFVGGFLLIAVSFYAKVPLSYKAQAMRVTSHERAELATKMHDFAMTDSIVDAAPRWGNPILSLWDKTFCMGRKTAGSCKSRQLHPFYETVRDAGYDTKEIEGRERITTVSSLENIPGVKKH